MTLDCDLDLAVAVTGHAAAYDVCRGVHSVDLLQTMSLSYSVLVALRIAVLLALRIAAPMEQTVDLAMFQNMAQEVVRSRDQAAGMKQSLAADVGRCTCWG